MTAAYRLTGTQIVVRAADGAFIPNDLANRDWREYQQWLAAGGHPDPYVPPPPAVPEQISDRQFFQAVAMAGTITQAEALAAVRTGTIPAALQTLVDTLPSDTKFAAEMLLSGAIVFERSHPMTQTLASGMGWTNTQVDDLWRSASAL